MRLPAEQPFASAPRISSSFVRSLLEAVERSGADSRRLLAESGLSPSDPGQPTPWLLLSDFEKLVNLAVNVTGDEAIGLHWGERASHATYDFVSPLVASAPTLRTAIDCLLKYNPLLTDRSEFSVAETRDRAVLRIDLAGTDPTTRRARAEHGVVGICSMIQYFGSAAGAPTFVAFAHERPPYADEYLRVLPRVDRFANPFTEVEFDAAVLDRAQPVNSPQVHQAIEMCADQAVAMALPARSHSVRVISELGKSLPDRPDMADMARRLGMSDRSLRRRLAEERTSYPELVERALASTAERLVGGTNLSIKTVAYQMGFSSSAAFHRAFRRWTALSPLEYRGRRAGGR